MNQNTQRLCVPVGDAHFNLELAGGNLRSLGAIAINGVSIRNPSTRFLPWFDSYDGDVFRTFRHQSVHQRQKQTVISTVAVSDPDSPFRERRDCSGDPCLRDASWDAPPIESGFNIVLEPVGETIGGRSFAGFKYWFEYSSDLLEIHRIIDRQTWEVGGHLDDVHILLRNWLTPPRMRVTRADVYSTVGLDNWAALLPGNLWGRWSLLPSFDMQHGKAGVLLGFFDRVSLIRTVVESGRGENCIRFQDLHYFTSAKSVATNPKTILFCPDVLDATDAMNLWTTMVDRENAKARVQYGIKEEEPPAMVLSQNSWRGFRFESTYEPAVNTAAEFGADMVFIDPVWEHGQAYAETLDSLLPPEKRKGTVLDKFAPANMCCTLDFEIAKIHGGEEDLAALVNRARDKGVRIISWMATHYHPYTTLNSESKLGLGANGIFAAKESGRHPDTGYVGHCWTANLNAPIYDKIAQQLFSACSRTGLAGFLWDSISNLGWWQVDYSKGDMQPQFDRMMQLYARLVNAGLYIMPEGIVMFSTHSCIGLHGGNVYEGENLGYSYNTNISLGYGKDPDRPDAHCDWSDKVLRGEAPLSMLFHPFAHKRIPNFNFHNVPREERNPLASALIKELFKTYKNHRHLMQRRTVLKGDLGVRWDNDQNMPLLFAFKDQPGSGVDVATGERIENGILRENRVYQCPSMS